MWKRAVQNEQPTLILEDDVEIVFERTNGEQMSGAVFTAKLELAMQEARRRDADVLYLGWAGHRGGNYKHHEDDKEEEESSIVRKAEYVWTTVAYVIWPQGARK